MDDIRVICLNDMDAKRCLTMLIGELRHVGMNANSSKTKILTSESSKEEISDVFMGFDDRVSVIETMWRSRSRRVILRSIPIVYEILKECCLNRECDSRKFRFAVTKMSYLIDAGIFDGESEFYESLASMIVSSLETNPSATDQYCKILHRIKLDSGSEQILRIEKYLTDEMKAIHPWQNYLLWNLLARKKHVSSRLMDFALKRCRSKPDSEEAASIYIYLYCVYGSCALKEFIDSFSGSWPYQNIRNFLISIKDLSLEDRKRLIDQLTTKTKGIAKRAESYMNKDGLPILESRQVELIEIFDNLSNYD